MSTATALPAEVQLSKEKPQGAFCLRTRYALSANSANSWNPSSLVSLPLQTGTPGTFTDVKQGCINCTIQISNTNPYVDFLNFGPCGAIIFFDEMRVYSSGTPVEENLRYSETVDLLMEQGGWQCKPFHVFRRNKWRANNGRAGDKHINFIKPSMVDSTGNPMFGRTPFMDKNSAVYQPPAISFGYASAATTATVGRIDSFLVDLASKTASIGLNGGVVTAVGSIGFGPILGNDGGYFNDETIQNLTTAQVSGNTAIHTNGSAYAAAMTNTNEGMGDAIFGRSANINYIAGNYIPGNSVYAWKNTQVARNGNLATGLEQTYPWLPAGTYTPSMWPDYQPCTLSGELDDEELDTIIGKTKIAEYMKYLANVRSLPIGLMGSLDGSAALRAADTYAQNGVALNASSSPLVNAGNSNYSEYRVSMPFVSGIYGILADKMFPDLLIGANNIRIEFKLATVQKALWLTMDPCRRVPGTVRDFTPFTGSASGKPRAGGAIELISNTHTGNGQSAFAVADASLGCSYSGVCYYQRQDANKYRGGAASSAGVAIAADNTTSGAIIANTNMYTSASAMGEDPVGQFVPSLVGTSMTAIAFPTASVALGNTAALTPGNSLNVFSNLPKPQYVPTLTPWLSKTFYDATGLYLTATNTISTYCNERQYCYGTYLPASVPQVRRCQPTSRLDITEFQSAGTTVFQIRDLQYIGEQVQLDDISTSAIIQHAATSEIVVWTRGYRSFEGNCTTGTQQNIILPIQIGQATALYLIFRAGNITTSFDYYSNSFHCPFVGLSFNASSPSKQQRSPDVGGTYTIQSSLDTSNNGTFSYQLFSGTKQYPLQPIQTVSELLVEREKSTHSLHNWSWVSTENMSLTRWNQPFQSANTTGFSFDPFLDLGYFTTFVPVSALDDQTITQNPYFSIAEVTDAGVAAVGTSAPYYGRIRGIRQDPIKTSDSSTFIGVLNKFVPPIGTFYLGWDFESWTNHEDLMRTGKFLGQEQLSVRMTGCNLMNTVNPSSTNSAGTQLSTPVACSAIVPHVVKMSFVPGGHMLTYY